VSPGAQKDINNEAAKSNSRLIELQDEIREKKKAGEDISTQQAELRQLKKKAKEFERRSQAIAAKAKARAPPETKTSDYTWQSKGTLGLRLQDTLHHGVVVSFVAPDAAEDMPDLTGMSVAQVAGIEAKDMDVNAVVDTIQNAEWPLTITFCKGAAFEDADLDGDGVVDADEYARYAKSEERGDEMSPVGS